MKPANYLDDLEHNGAPPVIGYPWVPHHHAGQSYSSAHPSTSWHYPPQGYQDYYYTSSPPAPTLPQPARRPSLQYRQDYSRGTTLRSFMEACLEALCCCWVVELCFPWQISVMESCLIFRRYKLGRKKSISLSASEIQTGNCSWHERWALASFFGLTFFISPVWFNHVFELNKLYWFIYPFIYDLYALSKL